VTTQPVPLSANAAGAALLAVHVPRTPNVTLPPTGIVAFQSWCCAVTSAPVWVTRALHAEVSRLSSRARTENVYCFVRAMLAVTVAVVTLPTGSK